MIVVAIIGILAAIAIPQYQDYVTRSRWQDALVTVASSKTTTSECVQAMSGNPTLCDTDGEIQAAVGGSFTLPPSAFNGEVTISRGVFTAGTGGIGGTMVYVLTGSGSRMGGCTVTMTGTVQPGRIDWLFTNAGLGCTRFKTGVGT